MALGGGSGRREDAVILYPCMRDSSFHTATLAAIVDCVDVKPRRCWAGGGGRRMNGGGSGQSLGNGL